MAYNNPQTAAAAATSAQAERVAKDESRTVVHTSYVTAQHVPTKRDIRRILKEAIDIAELSGDIFYYRWETSSKDKDTGQKKRSFVVGPSVKLTNEATRIFGNCVIQQKALQETRTAWIFTSAFIDLETGFTRERQFRMDKAFPVYGKMDKFRKDDVRFQIGQSKADRNVAVNALPQILIDKMLKAALASVRTSIVHKIKDHYGGDIQKLVDEMMKSFAEYGIDEKLIEQKLGIKRKLWDVDTLVMLYGDYKALESGEQTKETLYSLDEDEDPSGGAEAQKSESGGPGLAEMKAGDPEKHQPVKGRLREEKSEAESEPPESEEGEKPANKSSRKEQLLATISGWNDDEVLRDSVPGLDAELSRLVKARFWNMPVEKLETEVANIGDMIAKAEKASRKQPGKNDGQQTIM